MEWYDDDKFWVAVAPFLFNPDRIKAAVNEVDSVINLLGLKPSDRVLDLGCGVGRHSLELARRGFTVTALDRTPSYIEQATSVAREERLPIEFILGDVREFQRPAGFDAIINMFTSFGLFADLKDDFQVAKNALTSLADRGALLMELMGREVLARIYRERDWQQAADGTFLLEHRQITPGWEEVNIRWIILHEDRKIEYSLRLHLYSAQEIRSLLRNVGFREVEIFGSLRGTPYDANAERLVVVAHT